LLRFLAAFVATFAGVLPMGDKITVGWMVQTG
jgi:hypothetical protein